MLTDAERSTLLGVARNSIAYGLQHGQPLPVITGDYSPALQEHRASFVTLKLNAELRGCIGTLVARQSLVEDVSRNAFAAAFHDPRFPKLSIDEFPNLQYHISVLSHPEPVKFKNEQDLLEQIQPGVDGLVFEEGNYRGTFLPQVWESLPEPAQFLRQLKRKAGLPPDYWSDDVRIMRYRVEDF